MAAEIPDGAVLVARAILNSSLWTMRPQDRCVALTCIALCNKFPKKWFNGVKEIVIEPGQFVRSWEDFRKACGMPLQVVRTSVQHLENSDFLTRFSTRTYTVFTLPKYLHYQDLAKYSDSVIRSDNTISNTQLTRDQHAANNKQQHIPPSAPIRRSSKTKRGAEEGVVVVVKNGDGALDGVCLRVSMDLLVGIGMTEKGARTLASSKPVDQVLCVVQQARNQKNPGGWARLALEGGWALPAPEGPEVSQVMAKVSAERSLLGNAFLKKSLRSGEKFPERRPGEDEGTWFKRANDELVRRRHAAGKRGGAEKGRGQKEDHLQSQKESSG